MRFKGYFSKQDLDGDGEYTYNKEADSISFESYFKNAPKQEGIIIFPLSQGDEYFFEDSHLELLRRAEKWNKEVLPTLEKKDICIECGGYMKEHICKNVEAGWGFANYREEYLIDYRCCIACGNKQ